MLQKVDYDMEAISPLPHNHSTPELFAPFLIEENSHCRVKGAHTQSSAI